MHTPGDSFVWGALTQQLMSWLCMHTILLCAKPVAAEPPALHSTAEEWCGAEQPAGTCQVACHSATAAGEM
jgi:hypothetical protein